MKYASLLSGLLLALFVGLGLQAASPKPLKNAHAHNDYEHPRPLLDALDQGFCSVEADVFLQKGSLLVGHTILSLRSGKTLQSLYLDPLRERVKANGGKVQPGLDTFWLLIDIKTDAKSTCDAVHDVLEQYGELFTVVRNGKVEKRAVTAVFSGNRDREGIAQRAIRYAGIDGRPGDFGSDAPAHLIPWISDSWSSHFRWRGSGPMPAEEKTKMREFADKAHKAGRLARFWGTPDSAAAWKEQRDAGIDLINTDKLAELQTFLAGQP